ncbi:response regulator [Gracilibacillus sp. YIM 98692]|uniref:response regulator n=1 Tax=Gracilibacillus sp. YIM 98692 TaxID=2663532 RepID=UPI0013D30482|nr:response regulator [Gracilibacillus sp. YIM 98692]
MFKLLIVDDEKIVVDVLKSIICWEDYEVELLGSASNGREALELIEEKKPDIVLVDIRMPGLTGLELITETRKLGLDTIFIIISGYTEFEYAKKAIELQAVDYLVKPIEVEDIISAIQKAIEKYKKEILRKKTNKQIRYYENQLEEKNILDCILSGNQEESNILQKSHGLTIACIGFHHETDWKKILNINNNQYRDLFQKTFEKQGHIAYSYVIEDNLIFLYEKSDQQIDDERLLIDFFDKLGDDFPFDPIIGVSRYYATSYSLHDLYKQAKSAFKIGFFLNKICTHYDEYENINHHIGNDIFKIMEEFFAQNDHVLHHILSLVDEVIRYCRDQALPPEKTKYVCYKLISGLFTYVRTEYEVDAYSILKTNNPVYEELNKLHSINEIRVWLLTSIQEILQYITDHRLTYNDKLIRDVKTYLNQHFNESISLNELAEKYHISPAYLSCLFSQKVNVTISEYVTQLRLNKAKDLLRTTKYKVREICQEIGYDNQRYFHLVFKKKVGTTPGEYRAKRVMEK